MFFSKFCSNWFWRSGVIGICLLSSVLFFMVVTQTRIDHPIRGDARDYFAYAYNLKTHGVYSRSWPGATTEAPAPDAMRPPAYPVVISAFFDRDDVSATLTKILFFQAMLGVLTVFVYLHLFRRIMPPAWALAAGLVTAISPHLLNASVYLLTETLFTFALGAHLLALERALRLKHVYWAMLAGVLLAASFFVRPTTQYLIFAYLLAMLLWLRGSWRAYGKCLLWLILPVAIAASGWAVRNLIETGRTSDPTLSISFLHHGMYVNMMYEDRKETYGYPYRFDPHLAEVAGSTGKVLKTIAGNFAKEPQRYLSWFLIGKPIQFFSWNLTESVGDAFIYAPLRSPYFEQPLFQTTHAAARFLHPFLMLLSLVGACLAVSRGFGNVTSALLGIVLLYFVALHMIGAPFPRYSIPLRPINYGLAFYALYVAAEWIKSQRRVS